jgi:hypothetical protein
LEGTKSAMVTYVCERRTIVLIIIPLFRRKIVERDKIDTPSKKYMIADTGTSMKSGEVKLDT